MAWYDPTTWSNPFASEGPPPGVAAGAQPGQPVVYDPGTGLYLNTQTGAVSTDPAGQNVVGDPSLATQAARNFATSNQFLSSLGEYGQQYTRAQAGENSLAGKLNDTIAGKGPSVAQSQLEAGLSQIQQQQLAQASGATGEGGALARMNAANNTANAQAATNAAQAGVRANEVTGAETALGGVLGNEANQANAATGTAATSAANFGTLAGGTEGNVESLTQSGGKNQLTSLGTIAGAGGTAAATSDINEKTNVKPADMDDFLSKISTATKGAGGIEYDYKSPGASGQSEGRKVGVPAQAVAKSKIGKKIVKKDGGVLKMGHTEMLGAIIGALAHLNDKVKEANA